MDGGKIDVNITFDENNQIRVLSSEKYRETENLKSECIDFLKSKYHQLPQTSTKKLISEIVKGSQTYLLEEVEEVKAVGSEGGRRGRGGRQIVGAGTGLPCSLHTQRPLETPSNPTLKFQGFNPSLT